MKGSCLCGESRYEINALSGPIMHCHCMTCQKAHSAVFATTARVNRDDFRWLKGADDLGSFESTPGKRRWFCRNCGSHLVAEWVDRPEVIVRVATLDEDPGVVPAAHIWTSHDRAWLATDGDIPAHAEKP
ncbi:MAG TPA: aldehyde-activating protein [Pseudohongiella sp.]|nr:aldehyde-activating protein [Pseudohongiella sp.]HBX37286.1 aldehyde-activating protein [Pseudohongiella sp.]|tara:strand:- start:106 stop:495 length:390 start_codon:yes stop_codon:yes gene_type:complete